MPELSTPYTVWLSYVGYPVTTAVYFERALRSICRTITLGPPLPHELIKLWQLQNMTPLTLEHDIVTGFTPDMGDVLSQHPELPRPDLYLWVESVPGHQPANLAALGCPTACYLIDSHLHLERHLDLAGQFDVVFIAQREYLPRFREINPRTCWLPLGCDPEIHCRWDLPLQHDIGFVGGVGTGSRREALLAHLNATLPVHRERCFLDDMAKLFSVSRMVFNNAVGDDLNMRIFEVMSCGALLLSDLAKHSGQETLFADGEDYACYQDTNLVETARFYLENSELREQIARRGQALVHKAHTYLHRIEDLLAVALGGKADTFSAEELRSRSLEELPSLFDSIKAGMQPPAPPRSFVIPVLDYSPASEYNILTLLKDLDDIPGEVIVVFNGSQVGEQLKDHPRITRHAIMKQNIGVSRAWSVGLDMAESDTVLILNADAHITADAVYALETALATLPRAACVGPQGSFVDFSRACDYYYFDKGSFDRPVEVDAVSGFFFAVNRRLFSEHGIQYEHAFTPCYFEEWDIGLQIRMAGLKNYVVPTTAYDHHWSGTIRALRTIPYFGREETAGEVLLRNRLFFLAKWRDITSRNGRRELLTSLWKPYLLQQGHDALHIGDHAGIRLTADMLAHCFPDDPTATAFVRIASFHGIKQHNRQERTDTA